MLDAWFWSLPKRHCEHVSPLRFIGSNQSAFLNKCAGHGFGLYLNAIASMSRPYASLVPTNLRL